MQLVLERFLDELPLRTAAQFAHAQFHCGNPPPAAEPWTLTSIKQNYSFAFA